MTLKGKLLNWLPYVYFAVFFLLINNLSLNYFSVICFALAAALLAQLYFQFKYVDAFIGFLMMVLSFWFLLAYSSDFHKIDTVTSQTWSFVLVGGLLVLSNFVMTVLLFRNGFKRLE